MLKLISRIMHEDQVVVKKRHEDNRRTLVGASLIAACGLAVMSILNIFQHSMMMLAFTASGAVLLLVLCLLSRKMKSTVALEVGLLGVFAILFTIFVVMGGNEGFAALWVVFIPLFSMMICRLRAALFISLYFQILLVILFYSPLHEVIPADYSSMFLLRFPFLYLISFALATWAGVMLRRARYYEVVQQAELERMGLIDPLTGLENRNAYHRQVEECCKDHESPISVMYVDVNGLHEMNNNFGHEKGDELLCSVANSLRSSFPDESIFRMGGDEFIVVGVGDSALSIKENVEEFESLAQSKGNRVSIGYASSVEDGVLDVTALAKLADERMLDNKRIFHQEHPEFDRRARSSQRA